MKHDPDVMLSVFATFAVGGPQVRFCKVANRLGRAVRHEIVSMDGRIDCASRLSEALDVSFPKIEIRKGDLIGNLRRFRSYLANTQPNLLVTHNWGSIEWAMARLMVGTRHVHIADGFGPEERATQIRRRVWLRRLALRNTRIVVPSRTLHQIVTQDWRLPDLVHVANGIDLAAFKMQERPLRDVPTIGTVAALREEKNLGRLLRACAAIERPYDLVIAGDGPERPALERLAAELGIAGRTRFIGHVASPESIYADFDILAMSSDTEQAPLAVLEAMATGLPIAATDVGDIATMVSPENRRFIVPLEVQPLTSALTELLDSADSRRLIGRANRDRVEREFDQEAMFQCYADLFGVTLR